MRITVKLFASFRKQRFSIQERNCPSDHTVADIVRELGIKEDEIGIILVNGKSAMLDSPLAETDILALFPLVGGG